MADDGRIALLKDLAQQAAATHGLTVESVSLAPAGRRRALVIVVDTDISGLDPSDTSSPVAAVDLDAVAEVTIEVSAALDDSDIMGETPYTLEVSSRGVGRPLEKFEQFRRNVGRKLRVTHAAGASGAAGSDPDSEPGSTDPTGVVEVIGRLVSASPTELVITPDPVRSSPGAKPKAQPDVSVALADIARANVEVDFAGAEDTTEENN